MIIDFLRKFTDLWKSIQRDIIFCLVPHDLNKIRADLMNIAIDYILKIHLAIQ